MKVLGKAQALDKEVMIRLRHQVMKAWPSSLTRQARDPGKREGKGEKRCLQFSKRQPSCHVPQPESRSSQQMKKCL